MISNKNREVQFDDIGIIFCEQGGVWNREDIQIINKSNVLME